MAAFPPSLAGIGDFFVTPAEPTYTFNKACLFLDAHLLDQLDKLVRLALVIERRDAHGLVADSTLLVSILLAAKSAWKRG